MKSIEPIVGEPSGNDMSGRLKIPYLHSYWLQMMTPSTGARPDNGQWDLENTLLCGLRLNLLETQQFLRFVRPDFDSFEQWILEKNGGSIEKSWLVRLRDALNGKTANSPVGDLENIIGLTAEELAFWDEHGYVIVHDAVTAEHRDAAAAAIYERLNADPTKPETWYGHEEGRNGIWLALLRHPSLRANRNSPRLVKAFAQLWGREDLWATVDQCGFNPPENEEWRFPGPHLHWDMTLAPPHCFGIQGILYLTDTAADQGAFCCIPGFQRQLEPWLKSLAPSENPREAILEYPGVTPIAGKAGDLVLWHHALPHGSSPNRSRLPRVVQYISLRPTRWPYTAEWR
jgi:phytanoyl-CoA dioxygenase PhyH